MTHPHTLHLNLFVDGPGHHPAAWRLASTQTTSNVFEDYIRTIRLAERGKFDSILLADTLALSTNPASGPAGLHWEPLTLLGALAARTERIGLLATISTAHSQPYNIARRLATLDHASRGRAGWVAAISDPNADANFDRGPAPSVEQAREYRTILRDLWDSWQDDARQVDKTRGTYVDVSKVQAIDHEGASYRVTGPLDIPRPPQGHPVTATWHIPGVSTAASDADIVFTQAADLAQAIAQTEEIRRHHTGGSLRILPTVSLICSPSPTQVQRRLAARAALLDGSDWAPSWPVLAGTPQELADVIEQWFDSGAADGLNIAPAVLETDLPDIVDFLIPELQQRGLLRGDYAGVTLRTHYDLPRPSGRQGTPLQA